MGVPVVNTFCGGDASKTVDDNWEAARQIWPDIIAHARDNGGQGGVRELPDDLQQR
jgi:sugar phosphate isomerase/epimerase